MKKWIARFIGSAFVLFGFVGMLTPIPFGLIFFIIGLMFLIPTTPSAARLVKRVRGKSRLFDRSMQGMTNRLPYPYRRILRETEIQPDEI